MEALQDSLFDLPPVPDTGREYHSAAPVGLPAFDDNRIGKFSDPKVSGASDTQRLAAVGVYPRTGTYRRGVLDCIARSGATGVTDQQIYLLTGLDENTVRPRRNELMNDGWIVDSGLTRPTPSGKAAVVWVLSDRARHELGLA